MWLICSGNNHTIIITDTLGSKIISPAFVWGTEGRGRLRMAAVISFRECFRRRILKPMDSIVVSLMKSLQPAGELCLRAVVNNVRHRLPLSAVTQVRLSHAPTMEAGTAGTVACPEPVQKGPRLTR